MDNNFIMISEKGNLNVFDIYSRKLNTNITIDIKLLLDNPKFVFIKSDDDTNYNLIINCTTCLYAKVYKYNFVTHLRRLIYNYLYEHGISKKISINKLTLPYIVNNKCKPHLFVFSASFIAENINNILFPTTSNDDLYFKIFCKEIFIQSLIDTIKIDNDNKNIRIIYPIDLFVRLLKECMINLKLLVSKYYY